MELDSQAISKSFNSVVPESVFGVSIDKVLEILQISGSTWRKYHFLLRNTEKLLKENQKPTLGFSYQLRDKALDRTSLLLVFTLNELQKFFRNEKVALKQLYKYWSEIKCQVNL